MNYTISRMSRKEKKMIERRENAKSVVAIMLLFVIFFAFLPKIASSQNVVSTANVTMSTTSSKLKYDFGTPKNETDMELQHSFRLKAGIYHLSPEMISGLENSLKTVISLIVTDSNGVSSISKISSSFSLNVTDYADIEVYSNNNEVKYFLDSFNLFEK